MAHHPPRVLVVATDFSPASASALEAAVFYAQHGARVVLVHVIHSAPFASALGPSKLMEQAMLELEDSTRKELDAARAASLSDCAKVDTAVLRHDSPGEALAEHAAAVDADLVIVGSHGRTGLRRALLGSVAEKVVRLAPCPVLVVRSV